MAKAFTSPISSSRSSKRSESSSSGFVFERGRGLRRGRVEKGEDEEFRFSVAGLEGFFMRLEWAAVNLKLMLFVCC